MIAILGIGIMVVNLVLCYVEIVEFIIKNMVSIKLFWIDHQHHQNLFDLEKNKIKKLQSRTM